MAIDLPRGKKLWLWVSVGLGAAAALLLSSRPSGDVPAKRTVFSRAAATAALKAALRAALGREPTAAELKMVVAQSDLETRGWAAMWNWNFGNITGSPGFFIPGTGTSHKFKSYDNAAAGAQAFVDLLKRRTGAWALLGSGDVQAFSQALKDVGYFEGSAANYATGLASRYKLA